MFLVAVSVQLLYFLIYTVAVGSHKSKPKSSTNGEPTSIIVCAFNELENLKVLIPKLLSQDYDQFEIIIVNDQSTDGTYVYLMELKTKHPQIKMVQVDHTPDHFSRKKYGLTLGVKAASHERLIFTDADCYPNDDSWISSMSNQYSDQTQIVLGASLYESKKGVLNKFIQFDTYWTAIQYLGLAIAGLPYMGVGRNLSYRKSLFLDHKGFSEHQKVIGGDDDLFVNTHANRRNTTVSLGASALTYSYPKTSWSGLWKQKIRHLSVGKFYKLKHHIILGIYSLTNLLFWVSGVGLIFAEPEIAGIGWLLRVVMIFIMFFVTSRKLGQRFSPLILPLLDIVYLFYYIAITVATVFTKKTKWS